MQEYKVTVDTTGTICFYKPGTDDLHRLDGPAVEWANGDKFWYQNDKLHRIDGPAVENSNGYKAWFQNNQRHRIDGPAIEWVDGEKSWYQHNELHRLDGPAIEWTDGSVEYWIEGEKYSKEEFLAKTAPAKEMTVADLEKVLGHEVKIIK